MFCDKEHTAKSVEHIVPESFGNKDYIVDKGKVCDCCNNLFSKFENKALTNSIFVIERARLGVKSKKGKVAAGTIDGLKIKGNKDFKPNFISIEGKTKLHNFNPNTNEGEFIISTFDQCEVSASKLLLKIGLESIHTSRRNVFDKYNFNNLKAFLTLKENLDWPFLVTNHELSQFESVPKMHVKYKLKIIRCHLTYTEIDCNTLLFKFTYGGVSMIINLIDRNLKWIEPILAKDPLAELYPEHYMDKLKN